LCIVGSLFIHFNLVGSNQPEKFSKLVERASHLNILILSATDMCPTDDAIQFLAVIDANWVSAAELSLRLTIGDVSIYAIERPSKA